MTFDASRYLPKNVGRKGFTKSLRADLADRYEKQLEARGLSANQLTDACMELALDAIESVPVPKQEPVGAEA